MAWRNTRHCIFKEHTRMTRQNLINLSRDRAECLYTRRMDINRLKEINIFVAIFKRVYNWD